MIDLVQFGFHIFPPAGCEDFSEHDKEMFILGCEYYGVLRLIETQEGEIIHVIRKKNEKIIAALCQRLGKEYSIKSTPNEKHSLLKIKY